MATFETKRYRCFLTKIFKALIGQFKLVLFVHSYVLILVWFALPNLIQKSGLGDEFMSHQFKDFGEESSVVKSLET